MAVALSLLGIYTIASATLFFFPHLLHKRKKHAFHPVHISHRGGAGERIENTIAAYDHAIAQGTEMLELDVHLSRDGQVVVVHDEDLQRLCNEPRRVSQCAFAELPRLRTIMRVVFSPTQPAAQSQEPLPMPLLREVFERYPNTPINIDIKADSDELIEQTALLIEEFKREHLTVIGSAFYPLSQRIHKRLPTVPLFFSGRSFFIYLLAFYLGLLPFMSIREDFLELPLPWSMRHLRDSLSARAVLWLLDATCMSPILFYHLRRRGVQVLLWVLNDEASMRRAFSIGATGVMTDYPTRLSDLLKDPQLRASIAKSA